MSPVERQALLTAAAIEEALAAHLMSRLSSHIASGTIKEGSPAWETMKLQQQAAQRGAALREMADKFE